MTKEQFDTVVIGSGTAAYYATLTLTAGGQKVAVVDEREFGGTCALRGCQPKKYLAAHAEAIAGAKHLSGKGLSEPPKSDWSQLQALKNQFTDNVPSGSEKSFIDFGATIVKGTAKLVAENEVSVGDRVLEAKNIVLATGSTPRAMDIPGADLMLNSDDFLNLEEMPSRILFIGGGFVAMEFAHVSAQAGAEVTILQYSDRVLRLFDPDLVGMLTDASKAEGISIITGESATAIESTDDGLKVTGLNGENYHVDVVVAAIGRTPNISALDGDAGNVETNRGGIVVNEYLQSTTNPAVYAVGDVAFTSPNLAPIADIEGKVAATNILDGNKKMMDRTVIPSSVFTIPNIATVGLSEDQANEKGLNFKTNYGSTTGWPSSKRIGEKHAGFKVLIDKDTDLILGAHILRHNASEVINIFGVAMKHGITATELREFPWAYPTYTSDLKYMVK